MERSETLLCLFTAHVEKQDDSYVIEIPEHEVTVGDIEVGGIYRIAMLSQATQAASTPESEPASEESEPASEREQDGPGPPVEEGEVVDVEIEDIGDQGDGIARVGPGYVVIIPGSDLGERVTVEMTEVRENMAFAEVVETHDDAERADGDHEEEPTDGDDDDKGDGIFSRF